MSNLPIQMEEKRRLSGFIAETRETARDSSIRRDEIVESHI